MLKVVWQKNRDMIVAGMSISVLSQGIILRFIKVYATINLNLFWSFINEKRPNQIDCSYYLLSSVR